MTKIEPSISQASLFERFWSYLLSFVIVPLDRVIFWLTSTKTIQDNPFLSGNFAPLDGERGPLTAKVVSGSVPDDLVGGIFLRTGPNPENLPDGMYHWFDGDGMIHALQLRLNDQTKRPEAVYSAKFCLTDRLMEERRLGRGSHFLRFGWMMERRSMLPRLLWMTLKHLVRYVRPIPKERLGTANTAIEFHEGRLFALNESALPFQIRFDPSGFMHSLGYYDYNGQLKHAMTAHPKVDPISGEMRFIAYEFERTPHAYYAVAKNDQLIAQCPIHLPRPVMIHDLAITKNFSLILDLPLMFDISRAKSGLQPIVFKKEFGARVGIIPRLATSENEIKWFKISPCYIFHTLNAWEENDEIVLVASRFDNFCIDSFNADKQPTTPYIWRFNMKTGTVVSEEPLVDTICEKSVPLSFDFPRCFPSKLGQKTQFGVFAAYNDESTTPRFTGVMKLNLRLPKAKRAQLITFGDDKFGGEVYYQPKKNPSTEDDGYLLTFVYDEKRPHQTEFWIMDAKSMSSEPLCRIEIPSRIPYGFHCRWLTTEEFIAHQ